jgi:predicted Holliday junction resolvase-like endonuclease
MGSKILLGFILGALVWIGKFVLILLGIGFILVFVAMVIYVLKHDIPPRPLTEEEARAQAKAIEEANRKREEKENARKIRRELQCRQVPQRTDGREEPQSDARTSALPEGNTEGDVLPGQDQEGTA